MAETFTPISAGRELDVQIARLMGWSWDEENAYMPGGGDLSRRCGGILHPWWWLPRYSTDMGDAWKVAEKYRLTVGPNGRDGYIACNSWQPGLSDFEATARTAPMAICRAALAAAKPDEAAAEAVFGPE